MDVKLLSLNEVTSSILESSSTFTSGSMLAVDEIFEISVRNFVRHGVSSPVFRTGEQVQIIVSSVAAICTLLVHTYTLVQYCNTIHSFIHSVFRTTNGEDLPIFLLNIQSFLPNVSTFISSPNRTIEVIPYSPSELRIVWTLGEVYNEPDMFMDFNDLIQNVYTFAVSGNSSFVEIEVENVLVNEQTNETDVAPRITLNLVVPELILSLNIEVNLIEL